MNETLLLMAVFVAGIALGIIFFGGLWFTVKKMVTAKIPALWMLGSFIFRVGIVLLGFYLTGAGNLQRLIICLLGFIAARFIVIYFTRSIDEQHIPLRKEATHEA